MAFRSIVESQEGLLQEMQSRVKRFNDNCQAYLDFLCDSEDEDEEEEEVGDIEQTLSSLE